MSCNEYLANCCDCCGETLPPASRYAFASALSTNKGKAIRDIYKLKKTRKGLMLVADKNKLEYLKRNPFLLNIEVKRSSENYDFNFGWN